MERNRFTVEQIIRRLREGGVNLCQGKSIAQLMDCSALSGRRQGFGPLGTASLVTDTTGKSRRSIVKKVSRGSDPGPTKCP